MAPPSADDPLHLRPPQDVQATFVATLVDEWVQGGVRDAVVCPGSRSTPLALALADHPGLRVHIQQDERSGGFLALGLALGSGRAVVVLTTSGTAAVELHPAVVEAHHAAVPLLVCTADRPAELRDVGAPQTIDQTRLYGTAVRWYADPGVPDAVGSPRWRALAARALASAQGPHPGPVQLNLPFREPLVGDPGPLPEARVEAAWIRSDESTVAGAHPTAGGRGSSAPGMATGWDSASAEAPAAGRAARGGEPALAGDTPGLSMAELAGRRGVILAGHPSPAPDDLEALATVLGWPVVADPRSQAWGAGARGVVHFDGILRSERARRDLVPEVILRLGVPPASRVVNEWCVASGAEEIVVAGLAWSDPAGTATQVLLARPTDVVAQLVAELTDPAVVLPQPPTEWLDRWRAASDAAAEAVEATLADGPTGPNELAAARDLVGGLPDGAHLVVSSSMPIRDVERYATPRRNVRVHANRGANGIDGVVSTAVGVALATGAPTGLLIGDLAFLHDSNGLLGLGTRDVNLVGVVVDNDGGGIFSFLPQARSLPSERFETLFGTPHGLDLVALAEAYGVAARRVDHDLAKAVAAAADEPGAQVLVVPTDRSANVQAHQRVDDAIVAAVDAVLGP